MENIFLPIDINVFYVEATSFPEGIKASHEKLHELVPDFSNRRFFGLSRPENGVIAYKAAAEELKPGEGATLKCDTLVIRKGNYFSLKMKNYMSDLPGIGRAFDELLDHPGLDPQGYCVEWYISDKEMICMVRLEEQ